MWGKSAAVSTWVLVLLTGCNTDPLWEPQQTVEGPTTRIDQPAGIDVPDIRIADAHEVDLVEQVLTYRAQYHRSLKTLHDFYRDRGYETKRIWASRELADVNRIKIPSVYAIQEIVGLFNFDRFCEGHSIRVNSIDVR